MAISAVNLNTTSGTTPELRRANATSGTSAETFRALLAAGRQLDTSDPGVARQSASRFVSELFLVPLLSELREFPFGRELATGGQTESIFGQQLDQRVADAVANATPGLVEGLMAKLRPAVADGGAA